MPEQKRWYEKISSGDSDVNTSGQKRVYSFGDLIGWFVRKIKGEK